MSRPVDVLAWFGDCSGDSPNAVAAREARAAVAELIEAAKFARMTASGALGYTAGADARLGRALARVGGAP